MTRSILFFLLSLVFAAPANAQTDPDDIAAATRLLAQRPTSGRLSPLDSARALFRSHRYREAEARVDRMLSASPHDPAALLERGNLLIRAWRLDAADSIAQMLAGDVRALLLHGRVALLRKRYDEALAAAKQAERTDPRNSEAYLLEADVYFWRENPAAAEVPLRRALELDPLNADARFAYGYAIWRRIDARQLGAMAAQWNLALQIDPMHYLTHWHFGNGHTHLTYADYAQPSDSVVRIRIRGIDSLVAQENVTAALARTRELEAEFPGSLLAPLTRGSIFYIAYDLPRTERLDSAERVFLSLLERKKNYGPAHNGLAAVIKQRQLEYVANYASLEAAIDAQPLPVDSAFTRVFKDLSYYPGVRVEKMARQQLGPALAYAPFLARMGFTYTVPPLHIDLDEALHRKFFRTATTFDNRQWMDIRGAGGNNAAAGIEYVERGSHQERVVLLHEYVHQWHSAVLTDFEVRRIRDLYHRAMAAKRTLDYYASNNEHEFFAQSYEAFLTPVKVHPLNHKAMNTTADLIAKDPELYAFLDTLIRKNRAYLAGERDAMRSNWAHVYTMLAHRSLALATSSKNWRTVQAYVDTALVFDSKYAPAWIAQAAIYRDQKSWSRAERALKDADASQARYAPVYAARAELEAARARAEGRVPGLKTQIRLYRQALEVETDLAERARLSRTVRELYYDYDRVDDAIAVAEKYASTAPTPSTYLRDERDRAAVFAAELRSRRGEDTSPFLLEQVERNPQNFSLRPIAALALQRAARTADALRVVDEGQRVLRAAGHPLPAYEVVRASILLDAGHADSAAAVVRGIPASARQVLGEEYRNLLIRVLAATGMTDEARLLVKDADASDVPRIRRERMELRRAVYTKGKG